MMKYVIYVMIWIYRVSFLQTFRVFHSTEGFIIDPLRWFKETKPEWDVEDTSWGLQNGVLYFRLGILIIRVGTLRTGSMSTMLFIQPPVEECETPLIGFLFPRLASGDHFLRRLSVQALRPWWVRWWHNQMETIRLPASWENRLMWEL